MRFIRRKKTVVFKLSSPTPPPPALPQGFDWAPIDYAALNDLFPPDEEHKWRIKAYTRLVNKGYSGFLIHDHYEWAAIHWMATPESPCPPHLPRKIAQGKYWCFNGHTREKYRQLGLWRILKSIGIEDARDSSGNQTTAVYSDVPLDNLPSRRAHQRFGFEPDGTIDRLNIRVPKITTLSWGAWNTERSHPPI